MSGKRHIINTFANYQNIIVRNSPAVELRGHAAAEKIEI